MSGRSLSIRVQKLADHREETDLQDTSAAERLSMMWQLAIDAWAFKGEAIAQSRLSRHVVRVMRRER